MTQTNEPVLIYAPLAGDADALAGAVEARGLKPSICRSRQEFTEALAHEPLCAVVSEEGARTLTVEIMRPVLADAPSWSTVPLVFVVTDAGHPPRICADLLARTPPAAAVILQRPVRPTALQLVLENQVQLRRRQFDTRELLRRVEQSEHRQRFLLSELRHRTYNMLSVIQAKISMTARYHDSVESFASALSARIQALAETHRRLVESGGDPMSLRSLLSHQVEPYRTSEDQLELEGPEIRLSEQFAFDLSLIAHELATNAAKYGALSVESGCVKVTWTTNDGELTLNWAEAGGPPLAPPSRSSFGTQMIEQLPARYEGTGTLDFRPDGLVWRLRVPLTEIRENTETPGTENRSA